MARISDGQMPEGWHVIKSALLNEMQTAATFQHCTDAALGLLHARCIGESIAREMVARHAASGSAKATLTGEEGLDG